MARTIHLHQSTGEIAVDERGIITVTIRGTQTAASVHEIASVIEEIGPEIRAKYKKVYLIADFRSLAVSDATSDSRIESRRFIKSKTADAWALVGSPSLSTLASYIFRAARPGLKVRHFTTPDQAKKWFTQLSHPEIRVSNISLYTGIAVSVIGLLGVCGWIFHNPHLTSFLPHLRPINPVAALALILMGISFFAYWRRNATLVIIISSIGILLGAAALTPIPFDEILFAEQIKALGGHAQLADSAAICFMLLGLASLFQNSKRRSDEILQYVLAGIVCTIALLNIYGILYAKDFIYSISPTFVMAFNLALALFLSGLSFILLITLKKTENNILRSISGTGWLVIIALLFVQVATYAAWAQTNDRLKEQSKNAFDTQVETINGSVNARLKTYIDALYGFRGLFAASDSVTQADFNAYYNALELESNYPGLRSMAFIAAVKEADLAAFEARQKQTNPTFAIKSKTDQPLHFIATEVAGTGTRTTGLGLDIGSIPGRSELYTNALNSGQPYASGTIRFQATVLAAAEDGFFITIPVKSAQSTGPIGVVNANFNYANFFPALFNDRSLLKDLKVSIIDQQKDRSIFEVNQQSKVKGLSKDITIPVANSTWGMHVEANKNYGVDRSQQYAPLAVLLAGQAFAILLLFIFIMQSRARRQALDLADAVTMDLQVERNDAVSRSKKNDAILSGIGDGVFALDMKGRVTLFNPSAERITGYKAEELIGKHYDDVLFFQTEKTRRPYTAFITGALAGRHTSIPRGVVTIHKSGRIVPVADSAAPFYDARKRQQGIIVVFRDATEERAFERTKDEFVSLASHQLRTPLSAINWYVEMMLAGDAGKLTSEQESYLAEIAIGNRRMVELINSLLDVSRLDMGKLKNTPEPVDIPPVIRSLTVEMQGDIKKKNLTLSQELDPGIQTMELDPKLFRMILQNLISNAVKYTPPKGKVTVSADFSDKSGHKKSDGSYVLFSVTDTGYGIPATQQARIFGKMYRAENVQKLGIEGTGLGLYIVRSAAEKMGGNVWFTSMESAGTTFYVVLPIKAKKKGE